MKTNINDIAVGAIKSIIQELESMGWRKPVSYAGYIYIMVNPGWSDKVKIGYADDLAKRVKNLSGTNVPDPYHCYAAYKVQNRLEDKEVHRLIDGFDPDLRYNDHKEFYTMSPERAYSILESIAKISGTIDCLELNPLNDKYFESESAEDNKIKSASIPSPDVLRPINRGGNTNPSVDLLLMPETKAGTRLYVDTCNKQFYCTVIDHRTVDILGKEYPLWAASKILSYCVGGGISTDWDNLKIADGRKIGDIWGDYIKSNPHADAKSSKANNESLDKIRKAIWGIENGDDVKDAVTGCVGKWIDVNKRIVQFNGYDAMSAKNWVRKYYSTAKNAKFYKHFIDVKSGKTLSTLKHDGLEELAKIVKTAFSK